MHNAALHHISVSMQSNARSTSCYYLSLVTGGCAVGRAHWAHPTEGPRPTGISCPLQSLYIKSLRKVKPQRERALSAASAAGGLGGIRCRNNPFMDFRYVLGLFRRVARWVWFFLEVLGLLCVLCEIQTLAAHTRGCFCSAYILQDLLFHLR